MRKILALLFILLTTPASAQWQVSAGDVPIGRGAGVIGFSNAGVAGVPDQTCLTKYAGAALFRVLGGNINCGPLTYVSAVANLKALSPGLSNYVWVNGYFTTGDGGEGLFYWDSISTTADNGGTILIPNAGGTGRWKRFFQGTTVNVKWFGARCNGATNDTTAIQNAINYLGVASENGGIIKFPKYSPETGISGACLHTGISLSGKQSITLKGENSFSVAFPTSQLWYTGAASGTAYDLSSSAGIKVEGLMLLWTSNTFNGKLFDLTGAAQFQIRENSIQANGFTPAAVTLFNIGANAIEGLIERNNIAQGNPSVLGDFASTTITIRGNQFAFHTGPAISRCGTTWLIAENANEGASDGTGQFFATDITHPCSGIVFQNNWLGDVSVAGQTQIDIYGVGVKLIGNSINSSGTAAGNIGVRLNNVLGYSIDTNYFSFLNTAIVGTGTTSGGQITGNFVDTASVGAGTVTTTLSGSFGAYSAEGNAPSLSRYTASQICIGQSGADCVPTTISGDATLASTGVATLSSVITAAGPIGSSTAVPVITYDAKGRLTTVTTATVGACTTCALTTGTLAQFAATTSAQLAGVISDETGSGSLVFATSPVLVTPNLGTPSAITLTNGTGLPVSTGISGLGTGIATFLATPSSANLASAVTNETGSGALVFATSPALVTPDIGTPSAGTLTNAAGLPISTGVSGLGTGVATFLATPSSANLASAVTNETGSGALVFATTPTLVTPVLGAATATSINGLAITSSTGTLTVTNGKTASISNTLTLTGTDGVTVPFGTRTRQTFTSGSGTYTTPANVKYIQVRLVGGGGGGAGGGTTPGAGGNGGNTTFSTLTGSAGNGGSTQTRGTGGAAAGGTVNFPGGPGTSALTGVVIGGNGGTSCFGGTGTGGSASLGAQDAVANSGSGGGGGGSASGGTGGGGGGGAGGCVEALITAPAATYSYGVGAAGTAGTTGTNGAAGAAGAAGIIIVDEFYQ